MKKKLIEYFDDIQFQIDIDAQALLGSSGEENDEEKRRKILSINEEMIEIVQNMLHSNVMKVNEYIFEDKVLRQREDHAFKENLKRELFDKYAFYFKYQIYPRDLHRVHRVLLMTDWYLDRNQLEYLK